MEYTVIQTHLKFPCESTVKPSKVFKVQEWAIALLIAFNGTLISSDSRDQVIIWNVGQGQWVTAVSSAICHHFDMGGEKGPSTFLTHYCGKIQNLVSFSHWDWDHIGFISKAKMMLPNLCILDSPQGEAKPYKIKLLSQVKACNKVPKEPGDDQSRQLAFSTLSLKGANSFSRVFVYNQDFLIPGDSTQKAEKIWASQLQNNWTIKVLILGHHGSRTSTSDFLLNHLHGLKMAIASARHARYGHPHIDIIQRLRLKGIALLKTEDWGNISIEQ